MTKGTPVRHMEEQQTKTITYTAQDSGAAQRNPQQRHREVRLGRMEVSD